MGEIINTIEKITSGKSYHASKYCHDSESRANGMYDDNAENVIWEDVGETEGRTKATK